MSVPRKRRLPAWHLLTDEGEKYEFPISVCSISFRRTGACSDGGDRTARSCPVGWGAGTSLNGALAVSAERVASSGLHADFYRTATVTEDGLMFCPTVNTIVFVPEGTPAGMTVLT
jgi:hypothetical protein